MTRILEKSGMFYPQRKRWILGWCYYTETEICNDGLQVNETVGFETLQEAKEFFKPEKIIIHKAD